MNRTPSNVLIVGDDRQASGRLAASLGDAGYAFEFQSSQAAEQWTEAPGFDLVIIDWAGLGVCRSMREAGWNTPVLMVTERDGVGDKVEAFAQGVDDYLTVPFHAEELIARIGALLRRHDIVRAGELMINVRERVAFWSVRQLELTAREFKLLHLLVRNAGRVLTRDQILRSIGEIKSAGSNVVDVHIRNLRAKLGSAAVHLRSVRGRGYCYDTSAGRAGPTVATTSPSRRRQQRMPLARGSVQAMRDSAAGGG